MSAYHQERSEFRDETRDVGSKVLTPPEPGIESAGPSLFHLVQRTHRSIEVQNELLKNAIPLLNKRTIVEYGTGTTDASGNADIVIYQVPAGMQLKITRVNIEDATHTPATPFTNAAGWLALIRGQKFAVGCILDFLPNPGVASGAIIPGIMSDGSDESALLRGGEFITLHVVGTAALANTDIWVRLQGHEEPV